MRKIFFVLLMLSSSTFAQKSINNYKYIIVPNKFDFVNKTDGYQTSSLTNFLFNKYGFISFLNYDEIPDDLSSNRCLALTATVKVNSSFFYIKAVIEFRDCSNKLIYTSEEGLSKYKDYKKAYHEAIRKAFESVKKLNYKYQPLVKDNSNQSEEVPVKVNKPKDINKKKKIVIPSKNEDVKEITKPILFAQPLLNGFELVNTKPNIVYTILKSNVKDVYIIKGKNGLLYKNGDFWVADYYENEKMITKEYLIKF